MFKGIKLLILFGSKATRTSHSKSDTDIAVFADHKLTVKEKSDLGKIIQDKFKYNEDEIDIVDLAVASPLLRYEVAKKGKLLYGTKFDFIRFRVLAWKIYCDTAKFRRARTEHLKHTINASRTS